MFGSFIQSMIDIFKLVGEALSGFAAEIRSFNRKDTANFLKEIKKPQNRTKLLYLFIPFILLCVGLCVIFFVR